MSAEPVRTCIRRCCAAVSFPYKAAVVVEAFRHSCPCAPMTKTCAPSSSSSCKNNKTSENKVSKSSRMQPGSPSSPADVIVAEEMQELLCKLKDLVPYMPRNKKLSKLEIIQYVIDYIFDLQQALDSPLAISSTIPDQRHASNSSPFSSFRQPLSTLSYPSV